jgi:acetolactate synthase-like protein
MCRGLLGSNSNVQLRQNRKDALKEADVVILAGTVCDFRLGYGKSLSSRSKIISINRDRSQMLKVCLILLYPSSFNTHLE